MAPLPPAPITKVDGQVAITLQQCQGWFASQITNNQLHVVVNTPPPPL